MSALRWLAVLIIVATVSGTGLDGPHAWAQGSCTFKLGFKALGDQIPEIVGRCLEDERFNLENGNAEQRTSGGLLVWRKADNWTAFTDGHTTWINGPDGLADRPNAGPLFPWEASTQPTATQPTEPTDAGIGRILFQDNFDNPAAGVFPNSSGDPRIAFGYVDGEYMVRKVDPALSGVVFVSPSASFASSSIAVDARLVGDSASRYIVLGCRRQAGSQSSEYQLYVEPCTGPSSTRFGLFRMDNGRSVALSAFKWSSEIRPANASNHIELSCSGTTISASINGAVVVSLEDSTYGEGRSWMGVTSAESAHLPVEARFDNLLVTQR